VQRKISNCAPALLSIDEYYEKTLKRSVVAKSQVVVLAVFSSFTNLPLETAPTAMHNPPERKSNNFVSAEISLRTPLLQV
jgi:hypothetical protein